MDDSLGILSEKESLSSVTSGNASLQGKELGDSGFFIAELRAGIEAAVEPTEAFLIYSYAVDNPALASVVHYLAVECGMASIEDIRSRLEPTVDPLTEASS